MRACVHACVRALSSLYSLSSPSFWLLHAFLHALSFIVSTFPHVMIGRLWKHHSPILLLLPSLCSITHSLCACLLACPARIAEQEGEHTRSCSLSYTYTHVRQQQEKEEIEAKHKSERGTVREQVDLVCVGI
jgi:hypothetical protein